MIFNSYKKEVMSALNKGKKQACEEIGNYVTAEAQMVVAEITGNLRRSITYDVITDGVTDGVSVGVTPEAYYAIWVEKGSSKQKSQAFIEPSVMNNLAKIEEIAQQKILANMG